MYMLTTALPLGVNPPDTFPEVFSEGIESFLDWMEALEAQTRRGRRLPVPSKPVSRANAKDGNNGRERIELVLYTSPSSEKSQKALRTVRAVLADYEGSQVNFIVCDLSTASGAEADSVIFTPTLVKRSPGPRTWIVGNIDHPELLIDLLDVSGVSRRR